MTGEDYEARFVESYRPEEQGDEGGVRSNPAFSAVQAAARAFAAVGGRTRPDATDAVLGVLYADAWHWGDDGADAPTRVAAALVAQGVTVPPVAPPEHWRWRDPCSTEVASELAAAVVELLAERHPPGDGPQWGFKPLEDGRKVIVHEAELDLAPLVAEAARTGGS